MAASNCAHLTSPDQTTTIGGFPFTVLQGIDLQACSTVEVAANPTCTPGAPGCGWATGDMETASRDAWGGNTTAAAALLDANVLPASSTVPSSTRARLLPASWVAR